VYIIYMDDSGDEKLRVYSAILLHESQWKTISESIKTYRRELKAREGIFVTVELHATKFVGGRGRIAPHDVPKGARCRIFKETLAFIADLPGLRLFNAVAPCNQEKLVFERLINRINRTMDANKKNVMLFSDEGKDYTQLVRRMMVYNPIPSKYGKWPDGKPYKNMPLNRIIEDLVFRDSSKSQFIQMADFCAYALLRSENPIPSKTKYGLDKAFDVLNGICFTECFAKDPRKLGIIRET
jgi:hypothetical protein